MAAACGRCGIREDIRSAAFQTESRQFVRLGWLLVVLVQNDPGRVSFRRRPKICVPGYNPAESTRPHMVRWATSRIIVARQLSGGVEPKWRSRNPVAHQGTFHAVRCYPARSRVWRRRQLLDLQSGSSGVTAMRDLVLWFAGVPIVAIVALHFLGFLK